MPRNKVLDIIDEFIAKAKIADTDELGEAAINDALSKGATPPMLRTAIASLLIDGQNLKRPLGEEAARVANTQQNRNLDEVSEMLRRF